MVSGWSSVKNSSTSAADQKGQCTSLYALTTSSGVLDFGLWYDHCCVCAAYSVLVKVTFLLLFGSRCSWYLSKSPLFCTRSILRGVRAFAITRHERAGPQKVYMLCCGAKGETCSRHMMPYKCKHICSTAVQIIVQ